jgi:uncharacterized protein (TIGR00661 family)
VKILYAIQGTGNGHLSRAIEIIPHLNKIADTDILISGIQGDLELPFPVKYRFYGISFIFGKKGGIDLLKTILKFRFTRFLKNVISLPIHDYDLVISDFEPVSAWACILKGKKCIGLSHQNAVLHPQAAKPPKTSLLGKFVLKYYAPAKFKYGFHFKTLGKTNFTPVIRSSIRNATPANNGHYTVYLPAFSDREIQKLLGTFNHIRWEVFSKHCTSEYIHNNFHFSPVSTETFQKSFINCAGILCTAGFETPAEAIFMGKKLCVIPMKNQYEQACNAAQLAETGIKVIDSITDFQSSIKEWLSENSTIKILYPEQTQDIISSIIRTRKPDPVKGFSKIQRIPVKQLFKRTLIEN